MSDNRIIYNTSFPFKNAVKNQSYLDRLSMGSYILKYLREAFRHEIDTDTIITPGNSKYYGERIVITCNENDKKKLRDLAEKHKVCMNKVIECILIYNFEKQNLQYKFTNRNEVK